MKEFIFANGKFYKIQSSNGKEFCNSLFNKYWFDSGITNICGWPYHPQSQECMESFNKKIKKITRDKIFRRPKKF